jgi:hypothetical protein
VPDGRPWTRRHPPCALDVGRVLLGRLAPGAALSPAWKECVHTAPLPVEGVARCGPFPGCSSDVSRETSRGRPQARRRGRRRRGLQGASPAAGPGPGERRDMRLRPTGALGLSTGYPPAVGGRWTDRRAVPEARSVLTASLPAPIGDAGGKSHSALYPACPQGSTALACRAAVMLDGGRAPAGRYLRDSDNGRLGS